MDRRFFLKNAMIVSAAVGVADAATAAERCFPTNVDQSLFEGINRVKDPSRLHGLWEGSLDIAVR